MTDHDLGIREQGAKLRSIAVIVEDRAFQRRLDFSENLRRDGGGKMAKKQGLHMLPSPTLRKPRLWRFRQRWQSSPLCPTENDLPSSGPACWQSAARSEVKDADAHAEAPARAELDPTP